MARRVGTLKVGDPRGVLAVDAGRRHNKRVRDWRLGHLLAALVDERGTSSTCPSCTRRALRPAGRTFTCPHCGSPGTAT